MQPSEKALLAQTTYLVVQESRESTDRLDRTLKIIRGQLNKFNPNSKTNNNIRLFLLISEKFDEIAPLRLKKVAAVCKICKTTFTTQGNLVSYVKKIHLRKFLSQPV